MLKRNPETYNELILSRNILSISRHYQVSQEFIDEAYDFLITNQNGAIVGGRDKIIFKDDKGAIQKIFSANLLNPQLVDSLTITKSGINIVSHYSSSSGSSSGGSSSNNNNNNNNNNH